MPRPLTMATATPTRCSRPTSSGTSDRGDPTQAKGFQMRLSTLLIVALLAMTEAAVYAGFQAGGAWSDTGWTFPFAESFNAAAGQSFSTNLDGAVVGGQLG